MASVNTELSEDGRTATIRVNGKFDFSIHKDFREAYTQFNPVPARTVLDLSGTEYMDSSALGMVLLLKEYLDADKKRLEVRNARPEVEKILRIANFDKLMELGCA